MKRNETKLETFTIWLTGSCRKSVTFPPQIWQVDLTNDGGFVFAASSGPCLPHRIFQRLFLGFKWERI